MKKIFILVISIIGILLVVGCGSTNTSSTGGYEAVPQVENEKSDKEKAEAAVLKRLYEELDKRWGNRSDVLIDKTTYSISSFTNENLYYTISGKYYVYDRYGDIWVYGNFNGSVFKSAPEKVSSFSLTAW